MYYHMLSKIKNAGLAGKSSFLLPFSNMDFEIARTLIDNKYLKDVQKKSINKKNYLDIRVAYNEGGPTMIGFKIISKPSRRVYVRAKDIKPVRNGFGVAVISTSSGIVTGKEAKKRKLGGEYLFEIW